VRGPNFREAAAVAEIPVCHPPIEERARSARIIAADPERGASNVAALLRMKLEDAWNKALPSMKGKGRNFRR
jgi:hypothetical protein